MKFHSFLSILALSAIAIFSSCGNDSEASKGTTLMSEEGTPATGTPADIGVTPATDPAMAEPAQNAAGLWHYTCPKGCAGGAGSAIACATCGTTLTHSQAYHGAAANQPAMSAPSGAQGTPPPSTPGAQTITMPNTGKAEPPQNAAGVWHYTCPGGCAGGGGAAGPCAKCGKTLEHNKAYHQ